MTCARERNAQARGEAPATRGETATPVGPSVANATRRAHHSKRMREDRRGWFVSQSTYYSRDYAKRFTELVGMCASDCVCAKAIAFSSAIFAALTDVIAYPSARDRLSPGVSCRIWADRGRRGAQERSPFLRRGSKPGRDSLLRLRTPHMGNDRTRHRRLRAEHHRCGGRLRRGGSSCVVPES